MFLWVFGRIFSALIAIIFSQCISVGITYMQILVICDPGRSQSPANSRGRLYSCWNTSETLVHLPINNLLFLQIQFADQWSAPTSWSCKAYQKRFAFSKRKYFKIYFWIASQHRLLQDLPFHWPKKKKKRSKYSPQSLCHCCFWNRKS